MVHDRLWNSLLCAAVIALGVSCQAVKAADLSLTLSPIVFEPEPVDRLHPRLGWMRKDRIRTSWVATDLHTLYGGTDRTKAQIMADGGLNVAVVSMHSDPKDRSHVPDLAKVLPANVRVAHDNGLALWTEWNYGSQHQEPYHRYRAPDGTLAKKTCCPLDDRYIDRHVGRWAVRFAQAGADGFVLDTEMYGSDVANYAGTCVCDYCFRAYADAFANSSDAVYDGVEVEQRGVWLRQNGLYGHYSRFARRRTEDLYDDIRARCQAINPAFVFGYAGLVEHIPGITRGLGTSAVPCVVFDEAAYSTGPGFSMQRDLRYLKRTQSPAMYVCGLWLNKTRPQKLAERGLLGALYADGWWAWYGPALLTEPEALTGTYTKNPYGRFPGTPAKAYWDLLGPMHARLERLLAGDRDAWPAYPVPPNMTPPATGSVKARTAPITLDGKLDDPGWKTASQFDMAKDRFDNRNGPANIFWLCHDKDNLYLAVRCPLPAGAKLSVPNRGRDHPAAWTNNGVEVFIDPTGQGGRYAHLVISALGDTYESALDFSPGSAQFGNMGWNPAIEVIATQSESEYVLEVRLPFDKFLPAPETGNTWRFNLCRARPVVQSWSPTYGHFHCPDRFGRITFTDTPRKQGATTYGS